MTLEALAAETGTLDGSTAGGSSGADLQPHGAFGPAAERQPAGRPSAQPAGRQASIAAPPDAVADMRRRSSAAAILMVVGSFQRRGSSFLQLQRGGLISAFMRGWMLLAVTARVVAASLTLRQTRQPDPRPVQQQRKPAQQKQPQARQRAAGAGRATKAAAAAGPGRQAWKPQGQAAQATAPGTTPSVGKAAGAAGAGAAALPEAKPVRATTDHESVQDQGEATQPAPEPAPTRFMSTWRNSGWWMSSPIFGENEGQDEGGQLPDCSAASIGQGGSPGGAGAAVEAELPPVGEGHICTTGQSPETRAQEEGGVHGGWRPDLS